MRPLPDTSSLERLVPDTLDADDATGHATLKLHLERYEFAAASGPTNVPAQILDCACGVGYGTRLLRDRLSQSTLTGVDLSAEAVAFAIGRYQTERITYVCSDALEFRAGPFDMVVSLETIEHVPDPERLVRHLFSLIKPGGIFIGSTPITPSADVNPHHLHDFTADSLRQLIRDAGGQEFDSILQVQPFSPFKIASGKEKRLADMRKGLLGYYLTHPRAAAKRAVSTVLDGFNNKYLTVAARRTG